jgi:SRSO17 transposase
MPTFKVPTAELPDLDVFAADFEDFQARFADLFTRSEPREQAAKYLRGLMGGAERRNGWQLAEAMGDAVPDRMQRLLNHAAWSAATARDRLRDLVTERFGAPDAIGIVDETGFLKQGSASVGVQRQYTGTAGKVDNCQGGVFLAYASRAGHTRLDRALYLPQDWAADAERRARAHVPAKVRFHPKPALALRMLQRAWRQGVPMAWVTGDEVYGEAPYWRAGVAAAGKRYVRAVAATTPVWTTRPPTIAPAAPPARRRGRPRTRTRLAPGTAPATTVQAVVAAWPATQWQRLAVHQGEKGPIEYDWGLARVVESSGHLPAQDVWLLARRSVSDPTQVAYSLSNAEPDTSLWRLADVASTRFVIEQCFEQAKDDVGLDHYEVRTWPAWHRHITRAMLAMAWLASVHLARTTTESQGPPAVEPTDGQKGGPPPARSSPSPFPRWRRGRSRKFAA